MGEFRVDASTVKAFAVNCKRVAPELHREFLAVLSSAGEIVAAEMRVQSAFSSRIPATVRVRRRGTRVRVLAGGDGAPGAAALNNGGHGGTFRHPVFGHYDQPWAVQAAHPFAETSGEAKTDEVAQMIMAGVDTVFARL